MALLIAAPRGRPGGAEVLAVRPVNPCISNVTNEIANGLDLIGIAIGELHINKSLFDQDEQFRDD